MLGRLSLHKDLKVDFRVRNAQFQGTRETAVLTTKYLSVN